MSTLLISENSHRQPRPKHQARSRDRDRENPGGVYFFLDFSNIAINACQLAISQGESALACHSVRLSVENLKLFVQRNRCWRRGYGAAGLTDQNSPIKKHFEQAGIKFDICERGQLTGKEQNVDERIQLQMYRLLAPGTEKGTVVLATGDGNGHQQNEGFIEALATLLSYGFEIEVLSWRHSLSSFLKDWAISHGRLIELDEYYMDLTFVEGRRMPSPMSQLSRKMIRSGLI